MFLDDTTVSTYNSSSSNSLDVSMSATKTHGIGETAKIAHQIHLAYHEPHF